MLCKDRSISICLQIPKKKRLQILLKIVVNEWEKLVMFIYLHFLYRTLVLSWWFWISDCLCWMVIPVFRVHFFFKKTLYSDSFIKLWTVRNALAYCLARICSGIIMQVIFTWRDHGWLQMLFMQVVCHLPANNSVWSGTLTRRNRSIIAILKTQMFCIKSLWIFSVFELRKSCFLTKHCSFWFFLL